MQDRKVTLMELSTKRVKVRTTLSGIISIQNNYAIFCINDQLEVENQALASETKRE